MAENLSQEERREDDNSSATISLKRKDHPIDPEQQEDRIPKKLKNYFQAKQEENEFDDQVKEVDFSSTLSKGTEIIKTWHVRKARNLLLELVQVEVGGSVPNSISNVLDDVVKRREEIESLSLYLAEKMVQKCKVHTVDFINDMLENNRTICAENEICQANLMYENMQAGNVENLCNWQKYTLPKLVEIQKQLNLVDEDQEGDPSLTDEKMKSLMEYEDITRDDYFAYNLDSKHTPLGFNHDEEERIDRLNTLDETEIREVKENYEFKNSTEDHVVYFDRESEEFIYTEKELKEYDGFINDEAFYCKYLFEEMLPDESQMKYTESPFSELKFSLEPKYHNPFLFILETTMIMFEKNQHPQEHQTLEVSYLRLATSLFILNCINTELVYLKNRVSKKSYELMARATVRGVLDSFIDNRNFSCFRMDPDIYTYTVVTGRENDMVKDLETELKYGLNGDDLAQIDEEDSESDNESITKEESKEGEGPGDEEKDKEESDTNLNSEEQAEGSIEEGIEENLEKDDEGYLSMDTDTDTDSDISIENDNMVGHPVWDNPLDISQTDIEEISYYNQKVADPVCKSLASTFEYLQTDYLEVVKDENNEGYTDQVTEPIVNQELVTHYYGHLVKDEGEAEVWELGTDSVSHILDPDISIESQLPTSNSIYRDLTRLMRRSAVVNADSGAYFEALLNLKQYIQDVIEWISLRNTEKTVTEEDVLQALKFVHNTKHFTGGHGSYDFEGTFEYIERDIAFIYNPQYPPENYNDIHFEKIYDLNSKDIKKDIEIDEYYENNDPLIDTDQFSHYICHFLGDMSEIPGSNIFCDTYIEFEDGRKLGLYSPLIKIRCPSFYETFSHNFKQGIHISSVQEKCPNVDFDSLYEFFEYVYRGFIGFEYGEISPNVRRLDCIFEINQGNHPKEFILQGNDPFNSCLTLLSLWQDDSTKDFTLFRKNGDSQSEVKVHKFIIASRIELFRNLIIETPDLTGYDVSDIVTSNVVLERFVFYLYYGDFNIFASPPYDILEEDDSKEENEEEEEVHIRIVKKIGEGEDGEDEDEEYIEDEEGNEQKMDSNELQENEEGTIINEQEGSSSENEENSEEPEEEHINFSLDEYVQLFKMAHKFKDSDLEKLVVRSISHEINFENVSDFLTFSIDYESYDLFKACEFILISSEKELIDQVTELEDEREYFKILSGPINETNVIEKLSYVMKVLNSTSCDLEFFFIHRLDDFHKRNLLWYIIRNISTLNSNILQSLQYIPIDEKTNCAELVQSLAKRYHASLDSFNFIPTGKSHNQ